MKQIQRLLVFILLAALLFVLPDAVSAAPPAVVGTDIFIITVKTDNPGTSSNTQFTIPTSGMGYNYNIDCDGNGMNDATGATTDYTCNYGIPGTYQVHISSNSGTNIFFPRIYFNGGGDAEKLISVDQWGDSEWFSMESAFKGCVNMDITASDAPDLSGVTTLASMFYEATVMNADISSWDISNITSLQYMFGRAHAFNQDISGWDTSAVEVMSYMFFDAESFNQPIGSWDTSNAWVMSGMFQEADSFNQPIGSWDTEDVTQMGFMFYYAIAFDQNLGSWNVSNLYGATNMFLSAELSTSNYDALLMGWDAQVLQSSISFHGGNSNYCLGETARANMISSDGWTITDAGKECAPDPPTLISPAHNAIVPNVDVTYSWYVVSEADKYTLEVKKVSDNSVVHKARYSESVRCDATTCTVSVSDTLNLEEYKWHVMSWDGTVNGEWSTYKVFDTTLPQVQLRSPGIDAAVYGGRPTFKWYQVTDALSYYIEFYDATSGADVLIMTWQKNPACTPYCEYRIPNTMDLGANYGDYRWRVRAKNSAIEGDWSELRTFTYTELERTWQIGPEDAYATTDTTPEFEWGEITGATMYLFQLRLLDDTLVGNYLVNDAIYCTDGGSCVWEMTEVLSPGEYKWHVRAKNGRNFGRWTAYRTFEILP